MGGESFSRIVNLVRGKARAAVEFGALARRASACSRSVSLCVMARLPKGAESSISMAFLVMRAALMSDQLAAARTSLGVVVSGVLSR